MRSVLTTALLALLVLLAADTVRLTAQERESGDRLEKDGFWSRLVTEAHAQRVREREEREMAMLSVVIALLALASTLFTLYRYQRLSRNLARLQARVLSADEKRALDEARTEIGSLRDQADHLQRTLSEQLDALHRSGRQLDEKVTGIEKACSHLGEMSQELETLKTFQSGVEQFHIRMRQALNGDSRSAPRSPGAARLDLPQRG